MLKQFMPADILVPNKKIDMKKWAVIACDQYTSEKKYWDEVYEFVGDAPSCLNIILPEVFLSSDNDPYIDSINATMKEYIDSRVFRKIPNSYMYIERKLKNDKIRKGLIGVIDLNDYDFSPDSKSMIRPTEKTIIERLPPRIKIRQKAPIELPHVMILIDDPDNTVIEPLSEKVSGLTKVYDTDLMMNSGSIRGWQIKGGSPESKRIQAALNKLCEKDYFEKRYNAKGKAPLMFAVGDGNHSLATAKKCYENDLENHIPNDGLALVEVVNIHDKSLIIEPIHRLLFDISTKNLLDSVKKCFDGVIEETDKMKPSNNSFILITDKKRYAVRLNDLSGTIVLSHLQKFLDAYVAEKGGRLDYVHGTEAVLSNISKTTVGFILPKPKKKDLFKSIIMDGPLPRKTFSMGIADDKRFYLEARKIH